MVVEGYFPHLVVLKFCKRPKINEKGGRMAHFSKSRNLIKNGKMRANCDVSGAHFSQQHAAGLQHAFL